MGLQKGLSVGHADDSAEHTAGSPGATHASATRRSRNSPTRRQSSPLGTTHGANGDSNESSSRRKPDEDTSARRKRRQSTGQTAVLGALGVPQQARHNACLRECARSGTGSPSRWSSYTTGAAGAHAS